MALSSILYDSETGANLGKVDVGDGLRQKSWLDEVPQFLQVAAASPNNTNAIQVNYPEFLDGYRRHGNEIGNDGVTRDTSGEFNSVALFKAKRTAQTEDDGTGTGDGVTNKYAWAFGSKLMVGTVRLYEDGIVQAIDDGAGGFTAVTGNTNAIVSGAVNYTTGAITNVQWTDATVPANEAYADAIALTPVTLSDPVRMPAGGTDFAIQISVTA